MKKSSAFSLLETSIVVLILSFLIAGFSQSSKLIRKFRVAAAQSVTEASPVLRTEGLMLWYETTLSSSFDEDESDDDGDEVSTWYDINDQASYKNDATSSGTYKPQYIKDGINGLPTLRFDGTDDYFEFDGDALANTGYTIFIVEQRRAAVSSSDCVLMGGTTESDNQNLYMLYRTDTTLVFGQYSNDLNYTVPSYTSPIPRIHTFYLSTTNGKKYWEDGGDSADEEESSQTDTLESYDGAAIGKYSTTKYACGDISEVIIYLRSLTTKERQAIESYLSEKYDIEIS